MVPSVAGHEAMQGVRAARHRHSRTGRSGEQPRPAGCGGRHWGASSPRPTRPLVLNQAVGPTTRGPVWTGRRPRPACRLARPWPVVFSRGAATRLSCLAWCAATCSWLAVSTAGPAHRQRAVIGRIARLRDYSGLGGLARGVGGCSWLVVSTSGSVPPEADRGQSGAPAHDADRGLCRRAGCPPVAR
jgi:hypothetical protein